MEKLTGKYFRDSMPDWKKKKDCALARFFFRPLSFYVSAWCARHGINANTVSYISIIVAVLGCACYIPNNYTCWIIGAILFNVWYLLDCVDGNLARSYRRQAFGDFADSVSSYILVGFMGIPLGLMVYNNGGAIVEPGNIWYIVMGGLASTSDTMMRLCYQKYKANERVHVDEGLFQMENDVRTDNSQSGNWKVKIEQFGGVGGYLCLFILFATIFNFMDLILIYCAIYYGGAMIVSILSFIKKAITKSKQYTFPLKVK